MVRRLCFALCLLAVSACGAPALAGSWMFRPSYYSHSPVAPVAIGRQTAGGPAFEPPRGGFVQGGFRRLNSTIRIKGQTYDHLNYVESWFETGSKW